MTNHQSGVAGKVRVDTAEDVGERIMLEHTLAGSGIGQTLISEIVRECIDVSWPCDRIGRAEKGARSRCIELLPLRVHEEEETILEDRTAEGEAILVLLELG